MRSVRSAKCTFKRPRRCPMLFSAPLEVARTNALHVGAELDERIGQMRAHEAVGAGDEHRAAAVDVAEVPPQAVEVRLAPDGVAHGGLGYRVVQPKLATLSVLERGAGVARRLRLGFLVDALAPRLTRPFERFELDVDGVTLRGTRPRPAALCARAPGRGSRADVRTAARRGGPRPAGWCSRAAPISATSRSTQRARSGREAV